jgi:acyl carrier protein
MNDDTQAKIFDCVARSFHVQADKLSESDSQDTIQEWDSVGQVNLILELESAFGISFSLDEILEIRSIADIIRLVNQQQY